MITNYYEDLKNSPLFAFSLGSRELFHTNYLAWLFEQDNAFIEAMFGVEIAKSTTPEICRELHNIDLLIKYQTLEGKTSTLAIEVKVKDIAKESQLKNYDTTLSEKYELIEKWLITLAPVSKKVINNCRDWKVLKFEEVANKLESFSKRKLLNNFNHQAILDEYVKLLAGLDNIVKYYLRKRVGFYWWDKNENLEKDNDDKNRLKNLRFDSTINKIHASRLEADITSNKKFEKILESSKLKDMPEIKWESGFGITRTFPLVEIKLSRKISEYILKLGIQIQGTQYRRFIEIVDSSRKSYSGRKIDNISNFVKVTDQYEWLFQPATISRTFEVGTPIGEKRFNTKIKESNPFCRYGESFVYQYVTIKSGDKNYMSANCIVDQVLHDVQIALECISDREYIDRYSDWLGRSDNPISDKFTSTVDVEANQKFSNLIREGILEVKQ